VNGDTGDLLVAPSPEEVAAITAERQRQQAAVADAQQTARAPAVTRDGRQLEVVANIGSLNEARQILAWGAEGVGLLRTEFLYINRETAPTEDEQLAQYQGMAEALGTQPLVIRTLDIGGDKPVPYLPMTPEANPFLGYRAIRIGLDQPAILKTQLRAILRVGPGHNVRIMFPMIADVGEVRRAVAALDEARAELRAAGIPIADPVEVGVMIEIPSAAILADQLARVVDFFSIGTNDLTQYTLAADRTNERIASMYDPYHPGVLRLIKRVIDAAHTEGRWVGLCGEMAGDPEAAPLLLGFGLDEFSCNAPAIPALKQRLRNLDAGACQILAAKALACESPAEVRQVLDSLAPVADQADG
jgi:phosphocarrier protein FPr